MVTLRYLYFKISSFCEFNRTQLLEIISPKHEQLSCSARLIPISVIFWSLKSILLNRIRFGELPNTVFGDFLSSVEEWLGEFWKFPKVGDSIPSSKISWIESRRECWMVEPCEEPNNLQDDVMTVLRVVVLIYISLSGFFKFIFFKSSAEGHLKILGSSK